MAARYKPTTAIDLLVEALAYGDTFGERQLGKRHGDWWVWFGLPLASDQAHIMALPTNVRDKWVHLGMEDRARLVLDLLEDSDQPVDAWIARVHHFREGSNYGDVARQLEPEIGSASPIADVVAILGTQEAFDKAMDGSYLDTVVQHLRENGIALGPGLTEAEIDAIERRCGFQFPPDLRAFIERVHPIGYPPLLPGEIAGGRPFPDWRNAPDNIIAQYFSGVLDGITFDIEHGFWNPGWGTRPVDLADACDVARRELAKAPTLIPVFAHRFIPNEPLKAGNPVFSIHQTDIIYYGYNLAEYFTHEFGVPLPPWAASLPRPIRVWEESLRWRDNEYWPSRESG